MRFEDITDDWVESNKEMLHEYFFGVIIEYKTHSFSVSEPYSIKRILSDITKEYTVSLDFNIGHTLTIITGEATIKHFELKRKYSFDYFIQYMRNIKLKELV